MTRLALAAASAVVTWLAAEAVYQLILRWHRRRALDHAVDEFVEGWHRGEQLAEEVRRGTR